jgi:hypothetical protein
MGPNDENNSVLLTTRCLLSLAWQLRNHNKQRREDNGSNSADVAIGNVHRGPNCCLGEQGCNGANVSGTPDILHREVAGTEAILGNNSKTIAIQGGRATHTRDSSSRRGRQNTGVAVCNAAGPARKADHANGGDKQDKHGHHDGANECTCGGKRCQTCSSAGQGEHISGKQCHPPWRWRPSQESQAEESPLSQLQMFCNAQAVQLF